MRVGLSGNARMPAEFLRFGSVHSHELIAIASIGGASRGS